MVNKNIYLINKNVTMSTENEEVVSTGDEMLDAYLEVNPLEAPVKTEEELNAEAEAKAKEEESEKQKVEQENQAKLEQEEQAKQVELKKQEEEKLKSEQEKPKRWDEGLNDEGKFVLDKLSKGEDKEVYELLKNKYGYDKLSDEEKIMTYLSEKNPHLDREDLLFKAAHEYGIGVEPVNEDDLTDTQRYELKKQAIDRKGLLSDADSFFKSKAKDLVIPTLPNPLDEDEGYKEYLKAKEGQEEALKAQQEEQVRVEKEIEQINIKINTTAKEIEALPIELKISLDQGEFDLKTDFKLDEVKQKQLADYVSEYTPTQAEIKAHQNQNGELDMKGYMTTLAKRLFSEQMIKNAVKVAISKDREEFTEDVLKNSTLRNTGGNNDTRETEFDLYVDAM